MWVFERELTLLGNWVARCERSSSRADWDCSPAGGLRLLNDLRKRWVLARGVSFISNS